MKYGEITFGQTEAIINKLGGMHGVKRFLSGQTVVKAIPWKFEVWKTVTIGNYRDKDNLFAVVEKNCEIIDCVKYRAKIPSIKYSANEMIRSPLFPLTEKMENIDLVSITPKELGFSGVETRKEVYKWALEIGLELCPAEVGPVLLLDYGNEKPKKGSKRNDCFLAMEPIPVCMIFDQKPTDHFFRVRKDNQPSSFPSFDLLDIDIGDFVKENTDLIFRLPSKIV